MQRHLACWRIVTSGAAWGEVRKCASSNGMRWWAFERRASWAAEVQPRSIKAALPHCWQTTNDVARCCYAHRSSMLLRRGLYAHINIFENDVNILWILVCIFSSFWVLCGEVSYYDSRNAKPLWITKNSTSNLSKVMITTVQTIYETSINYTCAILVLERIIRTLRALSHIVT